MKYNIELYNGSPFVSDNGRMVGYGINLNEPRRYEGDNKYTIHYIDLEMYFLNNQDLFNCGD